MLNSGFKQFVCALIFPYVFALGSKRLTNRSDNKAVVTVKRKGGARKIRCKTVGNVTEIMDG